MATNVKFKRDAISIMRDGIKSRYSKDGCCAICGSDEALELHHYHTISQLIKNFAKELQLDFTDENIVLSNREAFYKKYEHELVRDVVTLCQHHHQLLHKVYTKEPPLFSANKQKAWVLKQKEKLQNPQEKTQVKTETKSGFARFL